MIYQSKFAPKHEFSTGKMDSVLSLLNSENENLNALGLSIISHSCETSIDQKTPRQAEVLKKIIDIFDGSINLKDACLESLSTLIRTNPDVIGQLMAPEYGTSVRSIIDLTNDKSRRTRVLACSFLTILRNADTTLLQDTKLKIKLVQTLLELVCDADQVGDDALFVLSELIVKEDMQRVSHEVDAVNTLCRHLSVDPFSVRRLSGILIVLAQLCSVLESCRSRLLSTQVI